MSPAALIAGLVLKEATLSRNHNLDAARALARIAPGIFPRRKLFLPWQT